MHSVDFALNEENKKQTIYSFPTPTPEKNQTILNQRETPLFVTQNTLLQFSFFSSRKI